MEHFCYISLGTSGNVLLTVLRQLCRAQPRPDGDALFLTPEEPSPGHDQIKVRLLDIAQSRRQRKVERRVPQLVAVLALVDAERVRAVLDGSLVRFHEVHEREPEKLLLASVFV
jgi:hypothetical protein